MERVLTSADDQSQRAEIYRPVVASILLVLCFSRPPWPSQNNRRKRARCTNNLWLDQTLQGMHTWVLGKGIPGTRQIAIVWNIFGISDFVIAVSVVSLSIFGLVTMTPDPVRIGLHPLALIGLFQLPLSIAIHLLALRKLVMEERSPAWQLS